MNYKSKEINKNCLILMASYNGERYIAEQIESIVNQTFSNWKLIIRDDGSSDSTLGIIKDYCKADERIELLQNETSKHGAYLNFFSLIDYTKKKESYNYYFFADQDDVWMNDKLEKMIEFAELSEFTKEPLVVYSDMQVIDSKGEIIYPSINEVMGISEIGKYSLFFAHGFLWGCDSMVNRILFEMIPCIPLYHPSIDIMAHDNYFGKFALIHGRVLYIDRPYINYRRHEDNATGGYKMKLSIRNSLRQFIFQYNKLVKTHARVYNQTLIFIQQLEKNDLANETTNQIKKVIRTGGISSVLQMKRWNIKRKQFPRTAGIYLIMLTKAYKKHLIPLNQE